MSTKTKTARKLNRAAMRALPVGGKIAEGGITYQKLEGGDGVFTVNLMIDRKRVHRVVGRESDGFTLTDAENFAAKIRADSQRDRLDLPKGRKVALGFQEAAAAYLKRMEETGGKDLKAKRHRLNLHLVPFFGSTPLTAIDSFQIERYKRQRLKEPSLRGGDRRSATTKSNGASPHKNAPTASTGTVNRELAALSHLLSMAVEWKWIAAKPGKMRRLREDGGRIAYLTSEQAIRLIECAKADQSQHILPFIVIGLGTGMRMSEILAIRSEHVDLERQCIAIPKAKAGARVQPITSDLADFLQRHMEGLQPGTPWLFPSPASASGHAMEIRRPFRRVVAAAGLDPDQVVRHTLRHTAITHLVQAGVDLPTVQRISGHKTLAMVAKYSHQNGEHIAAAMDKLQGRIKIA